MEKILGLDISSSVIGWSSLEFNDEGINLIAHGNIKPPSKEQSKDDFLLRLNKTWQQIQNLLEKEKPDTIIIEDYAKKFTHGRSSANTIIVLAVFNEMSALSAYQLGFKNIKRISVASARKRVGKFYSVKLDDKADVFNLVIKMFPNFLVKKNRLGNIIKSTYDEADSMLVALDYIVSKRK